MQDIQSVDHWTRQRQHQIAREAVNERDIVYKVSQVPRDEPFSCPTVLAVTSRKSAKRLLEALVAQGEPGYLYRVSTFRCAELPGLER